MATVVTSATPIIKVAAVAAVRRGWRTELTSASLPTSPNRRRNTRPQAQTSGLPSAAVPSTRPTSSSTAPMPSHTNGASMGSSTAQTTAAAPNSIIPMPTYWVTPCRSCPLSTEASASTGRVAEARRAGQRAASSVITTPTP